MRLIRTSALTVRSPKFLTRQCRNAVAPSCTVMLLIVLLSKFGSVRRWNSSKLEYHSCCHSACRWGSSRLPTTHHQQLPYTSKQDTRHTHTHTHTHFNSSHPERTNMWGERERCGERERRMTRRKWRKRS
jgi:hypothetical protein